MTVTIQRPELDVRTGFKKADDIDFVDMPTIDDVPLMESGSNANGNWIKYSDGTLVQWFVDTRKMTSSVSYGSIEYTGWTFTFPIPFIDTNYAISTSFFSVSGLPWGGRTHSNTTTSAIIDIYGATTTDAGYMRYVAHGRWK